MRTIGKKQNNDGTSMLHGPSGLAICRGQVIVGDTDFGTIRLMVYNVADGELDRILPTPDGMMSPAGMCVALTQSGATLLVADDMAHCIFVVPLDGNDPAAVRTIGKFGCRDAQFERPVDVATTLGGELVVADFGNSRVQILDVESGSLLLMIEVGYFVCSVAVDSEGNIVVLTPKCLLVYSGLHSMEAGTLLHERQFGLKLSFSAEGGLAIDAATGTIAAVDRAEGSSCVLFCEAAENTLLWQYPAGERLARAKVSHDPIPIGNGRSQGVATGFLPTLD
jgi:hypothetical protein